MKMAWKPERNRSARRARKALLARRVARNVFKDGMEDAFALCNEFLNTKQEDRGAEVWFDEFKHELKPDFFYYAYWKYRELKHQEGLPKKYRGMGELYREICISQDSCADARECRQGACFPGPVHVHVPEAEAQVPEPSAREMRAAERV
jgi:hypothetical protein